MLDIGLGKFDMRLARSGDVDSVDSTWQELLHHCHSVLGSLKLKTQDIEFAGTGNTVCKDFHQHSLREKSP